MFQKYQRTQIAELRPYIPGEPMAEISISIPDLENGSPMPGDMIARNPKNHEDQWLVAEQYFKDNFAPVDTALEAQLAEARRTISATHKNAIKHEKCTITPCMICDGGLFQCADCGAAEAEAEERACTGPEPTAPEAQKEPVAWRVAQALDAYRFYIDASDEELEVRCVTREQALALARELDPYDGETPAVALFARPAEQAVTEAIQSIREKGQRIEREANACQDVGASLEAKIRIKICDEIDAALKAAMEAGR